VNKPPHTSLLTPAAVKADHLLVMLLHYRDVIEMTKLQECLGIQRQSHERLGAILEAKSYVSREHLMSGYRLVYQRFSICTQCAESHDLQKGEVPGCPHCGNKVWFQDSPDDIFSNTASAPVITAPIPPLRTTAPLPNLPLLPSPPPMPELPPSPPSFSSAKTTMDPSDPFNMPIGYQHNKAKQDDISKLIATSQRTKRPSYVVKKKESVEFDLSLSMDELNIFQIEQMEKEAKEKAHREEGAEAAASAGPKAAAKPAAAKQKKTIQNKSSDFGDWQKVQELTSQSLTESSESPAPVSKQAKAPVAKTKKGCGKSAALLLFALGSLAIPIIAYAF
jgi:hypothetical protein